MVHHPSTISQPSRRITLLALLPSRLRSSQSSRRRFFRVPRGNLGVAAGCVHHGRFLSGTDLFHDPPGVDEDSVLSDFQMMKTVILLKTMGG